MITHARVVDVMSEAHYKTMACGHGKYLDQREPPAEDQLPEKRNVEFQCGYVCEFCRLSQRKQVADFFKEIEAQANDRLSARSHRNGGSGLCSFVTEDLIALVVEEKAVSINRHSFTAK